MAYSENQKIDIINRICENISEREASLRDSLKLPDMPDKNQFYRWIDENEAFREQYARACTERADSIFDEILEIADENNADVYIDDTGTAKIDGNSVQRSRLRVDARKWALSKMNPKKYGDKIDVTSGGEKVGNTIDLSKISQKALDELEKASNEEIN